MLRSIVFAGIALAAAPVLAQQVQLPAGEGRDIVATACTQCHALNFPTGLREGPAGWRFHVQDMVIRGAQIKNSEVDTVVNYLASNFAPGVNIPAPTTQVSLPEGEGKQLVEQRCAACHELARVGNARLARRDWDRVMAKMVALGAPLTDDEAKTALAYLQRNFSPK
jgi:mono/diheme cytochrome c family protein